MSDFFKREEILRDDLVLQLLWEHLKADPENKDRVETGWGTKTKLGLLRSLDTIYRESIERGEAV